jgi:hypothetical protein
MRRRLPKDQPDASIVTFRPTERSRIYQLTGCPNSLPAFLPSITKNTQVSSSAKVFHVIRGRSDDESSLENEAIHLKLIPLSGPLSEDRESTNPLFF